MGKVLVGLGKVLTILLLLGIGFVALVASVCGGLFGSGEALIFGGFVFVLCIAGIIGVAKAGGDDAPPPGDDQ